MYGTILIFLTRTNNLSAKFQTQLGQVLFGWYLCRDCYVPMICGSGFTGLFVCVWSYDFEFLLTLNGKGMPIMYGKEKE